MSGDPGVYFEVTDTLFHDLVRERPPACLNRCCYNPHIEYPKIETALRCPPDIYITGVYRDFEDMQRGTYKIALAGEGLPAWAAREEGEMLHKAMGKIERLYSEDIVIWRWYVEKV